MTHFRHRACLMFIILALPAITEAGIGAAVKVGTLGMGAEVTAPIVPELLNVRVGYNGMEWNHSLEGDNEGIEGTLDLETIPLLLDLHPLRNDFRLTGGAVINNNSVSLSADESGYITVDDYTFAVTSLDGSITFEDMGWYAGLGFGNAAGAGRINFAFDLGVMFHGEPQAEASARASDPNIQSALNRALNNEMMEVEEDLKDFTVYPVLSFGVSVRF